MNFFIKNNLEKYYTASSPEILPGVKKKSFSLPFNGGEIWFEHLDGMYQYTNLVSEKLKNDSKTFLLPSKPSQIGFVLDETLVTQDLAEEIVNLLLNQEKHFMRVCFIGTDGKSEKLFRKLIGKKSCFAFSFINDFEKAKEWLVLE
ncbi:MAG: hypothetical protein ACI3XA_04960 [Clostridia bacterium]